MNTSLKKEDPAATAKTSRNFTEGLVAASLAGLACVMCLVSCSSPTVKIPAPEMKAANAIVASAANHLLEEVRKNPRSAEAWGKYGKILMAHDWNAEASECFIQASKLDPSEMRWPYLTAVLLDRRSPEEAIVMYERAKAIDPKYTPLYTRLASTLVRLNRVDEAVVAFKKATELDSKSPQPWIGLARIASMRNDWKSASEQLEQAVRVAPNNREALVELTRAKIVLGTAQSLGRQEQMALLSNEKYQQLPDPIVDAVNEGEVAVHFAVSQADKAAGQGKIQEAIDAYVQLINQRPDIARPRINLASIYMSQRQFPLAVATLREVTRLFPNDSMGHYALSFALEATDEFAEARKEQQEAVRLKPDYGDALYALGFSAEREGDMSSAIENYRRAVHSDTRSVRAHLALGLALQKQGQWDEAIAELKAGVRLSRGDPVPKSYLDKALLEYDAIRTKP